jgi:tetratricopeptide (TPR) repeat protein
MKSMDPTEQKPGQHSAASHFFQLPRQRRLILSLLLALATLALYNPVTRAPFLNYDDPVYVTNNPQVRAGLTWNTVVWAFRTPAALDWHPITWLSYLLDTQLFGLHPAGYHFTNILIHAANAVLLFLILESATGYVWRSLIVAALFALHPFNVESVAWIAERKTVLSMFFFLLALAAYGWYARRPGLGRYLAVTVAFVFALMSKAQAITLPVALLLLDYWPLCRCGQRCEQDSGQSLTRPIAIPGGPHAAPTCGPAIWKLIIEKLPWFALSAASAVVTMKTGGVAFSYLPKTPATQASFPLWIRLGNAAISYVHYLAKTFWPVNLALIYPHPGFAIRIPAIVLSTFALVVLTLLALIYRRRRPFFVGWFWFLGTLVPMTGLVPIGIHSMADRYAYIPLLGIFLIAAWGAADLANHWHVPAALSTAATVAVFLALAFALHRQADFWSDNVTLWAHTLQITGPNFTAEDNFANALIAGGRIEEAFPHLLRARALRPDDPLATLNIATYQQMHGRYQDALAGYATVLQLTKTPSLLATVYANSGYVHLSLKQYANAQQDFEAALNQEPDNSPAYRGLGLVAQRAGDLVQATKNYQRSVEFQPSPVGYLLLAQCLELAGQPDAARQAQSQAARITQDPNDDIATVRQLLAN